MRRSARRQVTQSSFLSALAWLVIWADWYARLTVLLGGALFHPAFLFCSACKYI